MTRDETAVSHGFKVYQSNQDYFKYVDEKVQLIITDKSHEGTEWQVKIMELEGALYVAQKEVGKFSAFDEALEKAISLTPEDIGELTKIDYDEEN